ncbi:hypothetical protein [Citrobacter freundii]|uniref:hypothetical protein n=1 Tax=Citrobacter freundii TaxID=546 RepID=UPI00178C5141|nr:hypothetical protein [Citrobacter freundii]
MSAAKALAYALCDKLESKKVDEVVRNLVSSGWNIREVAWCVFWPNVNIHSGGT